MFNKIFSQTLGLLLLFSVLAQGQDKPIGKVAELSGEAYITMIKQGIKARLKKGQQIYLGAMIETKKNSSVLIELEDKMMKLVPESTQMMFFDQESWAIYQRTDKSIHKIFSVIGKKAESQEEAQAREKQLSRFKSYYENGAYFEAVKMLESGRVKPQGPELLFMAGYACMMLGLTGQSLEYFSQTLATGSFEYKMYAQYGLFINYLRRGEFQQAKKVLDGFEEENRIYEEMKQIYSTLQPYEK